MSIFVGQSLLSIELQTSYDLSSASAVSILYRKPDKTEGEWVGSVSETTKITYSVQDGDIDQEGTWIFQAKVTEGGRVGLGNFAYEDIKLAITPD